MTDPIDLTISGVWQCYEHALERGRCLLHGQSFAATDFPLWVRDLDRVWIEGPAQLNGPLVWRVDADGSSIILDVAIARPVRQWYSVRYPPRFAPLLRQVAYDGYVLLVHESHPENARRIVFWSEGEGDGLEDVLRQSGLDGPPPHTYA